MRAGRGQKPVKIEAELWDSLTKFLDSDKAKDLKYFSRAKFVTEAVSEKLEKIQKGEERSPKEVATMLKDVYSKLDLLISKSETNVSLLTTEGKFKNPKQLLSDAKRLTKKLEE